MKQDLRTPDFTEWNLISGLQWLLPSFPPSHPPHSKLENLMNERNHILSNFILSLASSWNMRIGSILFSLLSTPTNSESELVIKPECVGMRRGNDFLTHMCHPSFQEDSHRKSFEWKVGWRVEKRFHQWWHLLADNTGAGCGKDCSWCRELDVLCHLTEAETAAGMTATCLTLYLEEDIASISNALFLLNGLSSKSKQRLLHSLALSCCGDL